VKPRGGGVVAKSTDDGVDVYIERGLEKAPHEVTFPSGRGSARQKVFAPEGAVRKTELGGGNDLYKVGDGLNGKCKKPPVCRRAFKGWSCAIYWFREKNLYEKG